MVGLYARMLELASSQLTALKQGDHDEALKLLSTRQDLAGRLRALTGGGAVPLDAGDRTAVRRILEGVMELDSEIRDILLGDMNRVSGKMAGVARARTFCSAATPGREQKRNLYRA